MANLKFKLTSETKSWLGLTLFRIEATASFGGVKAGEKGGFVEKEENIDVTGDAWVTGNARVCGDAQVTGDAQVVKTLAIATRSDGYTFALLPLPYADGTFRITAGCRFFTIDQARDHWTATRDGTDLGVETFSILDHFERIAALHARYLADYRVAHPEAVPLTSNPSSEDAAA